MELPTMDTTYLMVIGTDVALLEGTAQQLAAAGHRVAVYTSVAEARLAAGARSPLLLLAERELAIHGVADLLTIPICAGGARLLYRAAATIPASLPPALQRAVLAELALPLERQRLVALVQSVITRVRETGRDGAHLRMTPAEGRPVI